MIPSVTVVVPMYNEEKTILDLFKSLKHQEYNRFDVIFVDNSSEDRTVTVLQEAIDDSKSHNWSIINESQKGTGAASDTGVRQAIKNGATIIVRTDADCILSTNWIQRMVSGIEEGNDLIAGKVETRTDDIDISRFKESVLNFLPTVARTFGKFRPSNKGPQYKGPYMMVAGCNVAFTSEIYLKSGGFPRTKIEDVHEDRALINNIRQHTDKYKYDKQAIIAMSARRVHKWGIINTMKWYKDHGYKPEDIDIR